MAIHLVYPHKNKTSAPNIIGWKLLNALSEIDEVIPHDFYDFNSIKPKDGDVLIGHPNPFHYTVMRRSMKNKGWKRKIIIQPYSESLKYVGYLDRCLDNADSFLAITGNYWYERIPNSIFSRWYPKMRHLDLAVDTNTFKKIKFCFNEQHKRKFVYIGNDVAAKNVDYLQQIAKALPEYEFHTIGRVKNREHLINHGYINFNTEGGKNLLMTFDFMITVGSADANPTTVLEAIAWGLIPICTPTSGYENCNGIINIPLNDKEKAMKIIHYIQMLPDPELKKIQSNGYKTLVDHYNWDRFIKQVKDEILSNEKYKNLKSTRMLPLSKKQWSEYTIKSLIVNVMKLISNKKTFTFFFV